MKYDFYTILNRKENGSMKWEKAYIKRRFQIDLQGSDQFYPMFIADMDFKLPKEILDAMHQRYQNPDFGYFHVQDSFFESILEWFKKKHHIQLQKEWIVPSIGTISSLHLACDMVARNKNILTMTPVYGPFQNCCHLGNMYTIPLILKNNRYYIDFDQLECVLKMKMIKAILLCNPHNPGGRVWTWNELKCLVDLCKEYHVVILSDEIHGDIQISNQHYTSMIEFHDYYDQIIVSTSPNKTFNISGLSTSFIICPNIKLKEDYEEYMNHLHLTANRMGVEMIEMVYKYGHDWHEELVQVIKSNIQTIINTMKSLNITVMIPDAGFLVWVKLPNEINVEQFILDLAKETHVLLEPGSRFVENYEGWLRINAGTSPQLVEEAMQRFENFFLLYNKK